jgi:intron-binding protein aquarius
MEAFPFMDFFSDRAQPLFHEKMTSSEAMHVAEGCYDYIRSIFSDLHELRPFEILRAGEDRADYLIMKGVRIVGLTTPFAFLHREKLLNLGFRFESLLLLDSGQILDSEAFFTFLLQGLHEETGTSLLERLIMVGDDTVLSPRVSSTALARRCNLNQSLFTRLTRLGFPSIELEVQSEYRPTIANVFRPCYTELIDSNLLLQNEAFKYANPGFCFETQFINVDNYLDRGETEPRKRFIQNLGEAEYAVAIFMYMRLIGYPNESISILTSTYGQKELIKDVIRQRCGWNKFFGMPCVVATIDEYQDQRNSFVIVSLVRTKQLGNLSDGRRLLSAFSRATTGLYILGRKDLFQEADIFESYFKSLWLYPSDHLWLNTEESFGSKSRNVDNHQLNFNAKSSKWQTASKKDQQKIKAISSVEDMGGFVHALSQQKLQE